MYEILILLQFVLAHLIRAIFFECIINWLFDSISRRQLFHVRKVETCVLPQSRSCDKDEDGVELDPDAVWSVYLLIMSGSQQLLSCIDEDTVSCSTLLTSALMTRSNGEW